MDSRQEVAIIKTLSYADIFDYPLTFSQLWQFLIHNTSVSKKQLEKELLGHKNLIKTKNNFLFLEGRENIVSKRREREEYSKEKMVIVNKTCSYIYHIPTILLIGISGSLAMQNAKKTDDIDLFVIAQKNTLWITRFLILIILQILGVRRQRGASNAVNKVCVNLLLDASKLELPEKQQNLYTAHEVVQLVPIFERNNTYDKFFEANVWVKGYLPNAVGRIKNQESRIKKGKRNSLFIICYSLFILEWFARILQKWYMQKHQTSEIVSDTFLAFYPQTYYKKVLSAYSQRLRAFNIKL